MAVQRFWNYLGWIWIFSAPFSLTSKRDISLTRSRKDKDQGREPHPTKKKKYPKALKAG